MYYNSNLYFHFNDYVHKEPSLNKCVHGGYFTRSGELSSRR